MINVTDIQEQLQQLVDKKVSVELTNTEHWKDVVFELQKFIEKSIQNERRYLKDMDLDNLKINHVEGEGYLRCLIAVKNQLTDIIKDKTFVR